jgi:hypothetical protein
MKEFSSPLDLCGYSSGNELSMDLASFDYGSDFWWDVNNSQSLTLEPFPIRPSTAEALGRSGQSSTTAPDQQYFTEALGNYLTDPNELLYPNSLDAMHAEKPTSPTFDHREQSDPYYDWRQDVYPPQKRMHERSLTPPDCFSKRSRKRKHSSPGIRASSRLTSSVCSNASSGYQEIIFDSKSADSSGQEST